MRLVPQQERQCYFSGLVIPFLQQHHQSNSEKRHLNLCNNEKPHPGGRIIDNLQIDNLQIDNLQIDNRQIDNQNLQIDNLQIDNLQITFIS